MGEKENRVLLLAGTVEYASKGKVLLCANDDALKHPEKIGINGVDLEGVDWLICTSDVSAARALVNSKGEIHEAWIANCEGMVPVNLAAALKTDDPEMGVYLVSEKSSGSMLSRARSAGVDGVLTPKGLADKFKRDCAVHVEDDVEKAEIDIDEVKGDARKLGIDVGDSKDGTAEAGANAEKSETDADKHRDDKGIELDNNGRLAREIAIPFGKSDKAQFANKTAFVISVLSGSGGVGRSTVTAISAKLASMRGFKTLVLDLDLRFGDITRLMGVEDPTTINDVMESPELLVQLADDAEQGGQPAVLGAPSRLEQAEAIYGQVPQVLEEASSLFDVIIANTGVDWSDNHIVLLERSDSSLFLIDQRASSIKSCQHVLDLCLRLGIATGPFVYAINHVQRGALFTSIDIGCVMQGAHVYELKEGGATVEELLGAGLLDELVGQRNDLCESIGNMLSEILPESRVESTSRKTGLMGGRKSKRRRGGSPQRGLSTGNSGIKGSAPVRSKRSKAKR